MRLLAIIFIFVFSSYAYAGCENPSGELNSGKHIEALELLNSYDSALLNLIPRLSPAEESWLDGELAADNNRRFKVYRSNEFARRSSIQTLIARIKIQTHLLQNHKSKSPDINNQIYNWTALASHYMNNNYGNRISRLHDNNVLTIPGVARNAYATSPHVKLSCLIVASSILKGVVLPKLDSAGIY